MAQLTHQVNLKPRRYRLGGGIIRMLSNNSKHNKRWLIRQHHLREVEACEVPDGRTEGLPT